MWRAAAAQAMGVSLDRWTRLGGGDFAQSWCAQVSEGETTDLSRGDRIFIKTHADPPPRHFTTEALGLSWLKEVDALPVPAVLAVSDEPPYLALQWIEEGRGSSQGEVELGAGLARLHAASCLHFGRSDERSTGSLGLPNVPCESWADFYASQRLLPLARIAADRQALDESIISQIERVAGRLEQLVDASVTPSRLHGDLWAGNRLVDVEGRSWLIDPAAHGGHREFDLAMMRLFGGFGEACLASYQEHLPLAEGWQERVSLHQLAPLIVHAIKFGRVYVEPTRSALRRYL